MKSSYLTNLFLAAVIVIGLLWLFTQSKNTENQQTISNLPASDISQIDIIRNDKPLTQIELNQQHWQLTQPFSARANPTRIDLVLSLLAMPVHGKVAFSQPDMTLNQFGFNADSITLKLNNETFQFGETDPLKQQRYVKHDEYIYLIEDTIFPLLKASATDFIDNRLIAETDVITGLSIDLTNTETKQLTLQKQNGTWTSNISSLSSDQLTQLVQAWKNSYAMHVKRLSSNEIKHLAGPKIHINFEQSDKDILLIMTQDANNLLLTEAETGLQYQFPQAIESQLFPQIN